MVDEKNSKVFIDTFCDIEHSLNIVVNDESYNRFFDLVDKASEKSSVIRRYSIELKKYAKLRNAIVHERINSEPIAEPNIEVVKRLQEIRDQINNPIRIEQGFLSSVLVCDLNDTIGSAAVHMHENLYSQIPVYEENRLFGLLTAETITQWIAVKLSTGIGLLEEVTVGEVMKYTEDADNYAVVSRSTTVFDVISKFEDYNKSGKRLDAIIVTHSGKKHEHPVGIITVFDLPRLYKAISVR